MRFLLANLLHPSIRATFSNIEESIPDIYIHSNRQLAQRSEPRFLKSHEPYRPDYERVVYLIRDPRAVAESYYYYLIMQGHFDRSYASERRFIEGYIRGTLDHYGNWSDHVISWLHAETASVCIVQYEELVQDPTRELFDVAEFLNLSVAPDEIERAVLRSSASEMSREEKSTGKSWTPLQNARADVQFIRAADRDSYSSLSEASLSRIEVRFADLMEALGYL